ncbi:sulfatase [Candidatus Poribacteria bacterium]|nr:sulfatase [Candidatus Poribacteria bacterium]
MFTLFTDLSRRRRGDFVLQLENENISRRNFLKRLAGMLIALFLFFLSDAIGQEQPPNVILISIDSLRADHLGCYGYPKPTSPNIDALANESVVFTNAISTTTWTLPAHISMLTSLYPEVHQVINDGNKLSDKAVVCAEIMKEAGYLTAGFVSGPYLSSKFGYNQGFDLYDDYTINYSSNEESHRGITSPKIHQQVTKWLEQNYRSPFFLFIHYWDVHYDYVPPPPFDTMFDPDYTGIITGQDYERNELINPQMPERDLEHIIALYDGEIAFTDSYIGKLMTYLKKLDIYENTMVILTSDHGDEFFEHGCKGHRNNLFDETLKVPLIIKFPSEKKNPIFASLSPHEVSTERSEQAPIKPVVLSEQVSIVDIGPTFIDYLSITPNSNLDGQSLLPLVAGNIQTGTEVPTNFKPYKFADLHGFMKCVRTNQFKYIHIAQAEDVRKKETRIFSLHRLFDKIRESQDMKAEEIEKTLLFNLQDDPIECHNLAMSNPEIKIEMHQILMNWLNKSKILAENIGKSDFEYDENLKKKLRDLGYIQ